MKATVVLQKGYEASKELAKEIQLFAKNVAASYKSPRIIDFVSELPKTISGKSAAPLSATRIRKMPTPPMPLRTQPMRSSPRPKKKRIKI